MQLKKIFHFKKYNTYNYKTIIVHKNIILLHCYYNNIEFKSILCIICYVEHFVNIHAQTTGLRPHLSTNETQTIGPMGILKFQFGGRRENDSLI